MPAVYKKVTGKSSATLKRFERATARLSESPSVQTNVNYLSAKETSCQTDHYDEPCIRKEKVTLFCSLNGNDSGTQACIQLVNSNVSEVSVQTESVKFRKVSTSDAICGPDKTAGHFSGVNCITTDEQMTGLSGVCLAVFQFLLFYIPDKDFSKVSRENRLLLFLMKIKHGLTFTSLATLFSIHRSTAGRIFIEILDTLSNSTESLVYWPSSFSIKSTLPKVFHEYPNLRVIIDCTELRAERPPRVDQQVLMYSSYKGTYTIKYLVGISPTGMISFISKGYGGRTTDSFITIDCGLLNLIEKGDQIMSDKGFPDIKATIENNNCLLVMPPFASKNKQFTQNEVDDTYAIASVRIHVERCIGRIRT